MIHTRFLLALACSVMLLTTIAFAKQSQPWTMVVIPDTQSYVDNSKNLPVFEQIFSWIIDNKDEYNIVAVLQEGDIVYQNNLRFGQIGTGDQNSSQQWANAQEQFHRLNGVVPYILCLGNHDYGTTNAQSRETRFNEYFKADDNELIDPAQGGALVEMGLNAFGEPTMENAAYEIDPPFGRKLLVLSLEWGPRDSIVEWAREIAGRPEYAGHLKVLLTHAYLCFDGNRHDWRSKTICQGDNPYIYRGTSADTNDGEELWQKLVRLQQGFELVLCGHVGGDMVDYLKSKNDHGEYVHQILFNAQFLPNGGNGWIRLLQFHPDGKVHVRTFSPHLLNDGDDKTEHWRMGQFDNFLIKLSDAR